MNLKIFNTHLITLLLSGLIGVTSIAGCTSNNITDIFATGIEDNNPENTIPTGNNESNQAEIETINPENDELINPIVDNENNQAEILELTDDINIEQSLFIAMTHLVVSKINEAGEKEYALIRKSILGGDKCTVLIPFGEYCSFRYIANDENSNIAYEYLRVENLDGKHGLIDFLTNELIYLARV